MSLNLILLDPMGASKFDAEKENDIRVSTVKHSPHVMIWGCISKYKTESLIMLQRMVNAEKYKEIILGGLVPSIESIT